HTWSALATGLMLNATTPGRVYAFAAFDDGGGLALYAGGQFVAPGGPSYVARFDGTSWSSVGVQRPSAMSPAYDLDVFDDGAPGPRRLAITDRNGVVAWDGVTWSAVGTCSPCAFGNCTEVSGALASADAGAFGVARLFVGGEFTSNGTSPSNDF